MTPDIELLKSAANAISLDYIDCGRLDGSGDLIARQTGKIWNPLTDDGDALRLAVKLEMQVVIGYRRIEVCIVSDSDEAAIGAYENKVGDLCAATRRAIVRAAAEIGKQQG